ncbi:MAG: two-component sensor histidine kinase [Mucilaginibacter sp.]|nr:two-component sensor histidine kinase [Mucilaginibacter sp.]
MMLTDEANAPAYLNRAFQSQFGYIIDEVPDQSTWLKKAYPNLDYRIQIMENWKEALASALECGDASAHLVSKICCADGVFRWFDVHQHTIGTKNAFTFLNVDELKKHSEDLADIVQVKENQLCIIAHDVRSPLSFIKQIVNSREKINLSERDIEDLFFRMSNQVDHVFSIVNSLLMRTSDELGRFIAHREPINLRDFFSKYSGYYNERLRSQNIGLVLELAEDAVLNYDSSILDVVCRNLLDNAIKFTGNNGMIYISFKKMVGHTKLFIRDTGTGMSPEQIAQIINNKGRRKTPQKIADGFGLGLLFAKEFLEKYHGRLSVKSEIGVGTSFIIDITDHFLN